MNEFFFGNEPIQWTQEVIGLGNPLMGDDGLGLVVLEQLREHWALPAP